MARREEKANRTVVVGMIGRIAPAVLLGSMAAVSNTDTGAAASLSAAPSRRLTKQRRIIQLKDVQGSPDKGLRYCWLAQRSDPLNLIQFILA